jgi:hypothetical protein
MRLRLCGRFKKRNALRFGPALAFKSRRGNLRRAGENEIGEPA